MMHLRQLGTVGMLAVVVTALAPPAAHGGRGDTAKALVVCAQRRNDKVIKVRAGTCRSNESAVPLDADTLQGFTPQQLIAAKVLPSGSDGANGPSLVDGAGQLVGYLVPTPTGTRLLRPVGAGLVALTVQQATGAPADLAWRSERGLTYFHQSADCSSPPLLANGLGYDRVIRDGHILVGQEGKVVYPGDFDSSRALGLTAVQSYSTPADDETGTCSHDPGDPASVPVAGGRCCVSLSPYTELKDVGPLVSEDMPPFVQPFHIGGF